jgi:hypothetical protein
MKLTETDVQLATHNSPQYTSKFQVGVMHRCGTADHEYNRVHLMEQQVAAKYSSAWFVIFHYSRDQ